jgi:hypothetical protein
MRRRRTALEWGLILMMGVVLAVATLWGSSYFIDDTLIYLGIPYFHGLHFTLGGGDICLFDQTEIGRGGNLAPYVVNPRTHIAPPIRRIGRFTIPGFDFNYCQFAPDGYITWSIRSSLLYPIMVLLLVAVVLGCRLKRRRRGMEAEGLSTAVLA